MRATIDAAGRVVVPKPLRDELGLVPGEPLELEARDGRLEIEPVATPVTLVEEDGAVFAVPDRELPPLTAEQVRATLERVRR